MPARTIVQLHASNNAFENGKVQEEKRDCVQDKE